MKAAAVALTVIFGMGGTAYAANKLYNIYIEKEKTYGVNITYASNASDECDVTLTGDSWKGGEIPKVTLSVDYVPKGMVIADGMEDYTENGDNIVQKVIIGNKENPFGSGVSFGFATLNPDVSFELHERYVKEAKEIDVNGNPAVCIEYDEIKNVNTNRTCSLYVFYQELPYVLQMTIFEGTDIDTAVQIAEGLKLTITEDEHAKHLVDAPAYEPVVAEELEEEIPDASSDFVVADAEQMANTHAVGEAFDYKAAVGGTVTAKVSSVTVCDDLSMLDKEVMKYYGMNLQPGETQTIYEAFFVPENMLEYMYLNLNGGAIESQQAFDPAALEIGYVDIRQ